MGSSCLICFSPWGTRIKAERLNKLTNSEIYERYKDKMPYTGSLSAFSKMLYRHISDDHKTDAIIVPSVPGDAVKTTRATIENFGQRMLEAGMAKLDSLNLDDPNDLKRLQYKDVVSAQKLILDARKLKMGEDAMTLMMCKLFGPPSLNTIEGEIVDVDS